MINYKRLNNEMIRNKYSILFYMKKSKRDSTVGSIYVRLTLNGKVIDLCNSGVKCAVNDFDTKKQKTNNQDLNARLTELTCDIIYFIENTPNPTCLRIRELIKGNSEMNPQLLKVLNDYMDNFKSINAHNTNRDWNAKIAKLELYLRENGNENMEARRFNLQEFSRFKTWLMRKHDNTENSANKYGMKFRKALGWAFNQGMIGTNPLLEVKMKISYEPNLTHLEWNWVDKLRIAKFEGKCKKAVDMYIFACCTGVCYADLMNLKTEHLEHHSEFGLIITNKRQKVKSVYSTPLWGYAKEIFEEFGGLENIPKLTNQKVNDYIKIALYRIGYEKAEEITFHTGRKTFVNYCLNDKLLEPHIVATYTGHQKIEEIKAYGKVKKETAIKNFYRI